MKRLINRNRIREFITKPDVFQEWRTELVYEIIFSLGIALPHITDGSDFTIDKKLLNPGKCSLSDMNLRSPGPVAVQNITLKDRPGM